MSQTSLGLAIITKNFKDSERLISLYEPLFDEIYVQVNGRGFKAPETSPKVHVSTFKWVNDFSKARNALNKHIKTDYYVWLDTDDTIDNPENLRQIVADMEANELDATYLEYIYGYNEEREPIAVHWRERVIRTKAPFKWVGAVHETLISDEQPHGAKDERVVVRHNYKTPDEIMQSAIRNHEIMEEQVKKGDEDPRTLYYLGRSYFMLERFQESAQTLLIYTEQSGWDEQKYDAWMKIGDALIMMDEHDKAINANLEAIKLNPSCPDAFLKMGDLYLALEQPSRAVEWLKTGLTKPPTETLEITDPTLYTYRPLVSLALCYFRLAKINEAKKYIDMAAKFQPKTKLFKGTYDVITKAYLEELTIRQARVLGDVVEKQGNVKSYIDGLPGYIKNDLRLRPLRIKAYPPKKWPEKSIVFYCGEQWEEWGPDMLAEGQGAGGSEEAIIYLSRELAKLGWNVTVYNQRVEELVDPYFTQNWGEVGNIMTSEGVNNYAVEPEADILYKGKLEQFKFAPGGLVTYKPWETFNPEDEFDVFVAWRSPWMANKLKIKARIKAVDMHDTPLGHQSITPKALEYIDKVFLKSDFQKEMGDYPVPDDKAVVVPNGIVPDQFKNLDVKRNPKKVIYASSADRGLDTLVREVWPEVKKEVPDAELVWAYGWNSYDALHKGNAERGKWKWELKRDMYNNGVKELGRLSHEDLAKEMASCGVWAYPTEFPEIDCITAKKAQAAGCDPITSGYAALQGSVLKDEEEVVDINLKPDEIKKFTRRLIDAIKNPISEKQREATAKKVLTKFAWVEIARAWDEAL